MAFEVKLAVRFADIDWARVVYFARYFDFAHRCFEDFFNVHAQVPYAQVLEARKLGFPIVHSEADFFGPLRLGDTARVVMEVERVTAKSVTSRFTLYRGDTDEKVAVVLMKQAAIDTTTFKGVEFPADVQALFAAQLTTAPR